MKKFSGYILAGGKSSRMGSDKAFLQLNGETFLERAAKNLSDVCENRLKIVINKNQAEKFRQKFPGGDFIYDIYQERGAIGGIYAALKDCETEFAFILAVDLPLVKSETILSLSKVAQSEKDFSAIVPRQKDGRFQPLCAVYKTEKCLPFIEKLLAEKSSVSMREFLQLIPVRYVGNDELGEDLFFNVNQPADLEKLYDFKRKE